MGERREGQRRHELRRGGGHGHVHHRAALGQQAHQRDGLVGGDAAGHADHHAPAGERAAILGHRSTAGLPTLSWSPCRPLGSPRTRSGCRAASGPARWRRSPARRAATARGCIRRSRSRSPGSRRGSARPARRAGRSAGRSPGRCSRAPSRSAWRGSCSRRWRAAAGAARSAAACWRSRPAPRARGRAPARWRRRCRRPSALSRSKLVLVPRSMTIAGPPNSVRAARALQSRSAPASAGRSISIAQRAGQRRGVDR